MAAKDGEVRCDDKGRVLLPKDVRDRYGDRYVLVQSAHGVWLLPRSRDPLAALERIGKALPDVPIAELKRRARDRARELAQRKADRVR